MEILEESFVKVAVTKKAWCSVAEKDGGHGFVIVAYFLVICCIYIVAQ